MTDAEDDKPSADPFLIRGREALRSAEVKLTAQALALQAAEVRATAITGWAVAGTLAALAVVFGHYPAPLQIAAIPVAAELACVGILACTVLMPEEWTTAGYHPGEIVDRPKSENETAILYALVVGCRAGIRKTASGSRPPQLAYGLRFGAWPPLLCYRRRCRRRGLCSGA